jgi:4-amino-4-deoxy-L-arabinose transferase-like glycosyltransferase
LLGLSLLRWAREVHLDDVDAQTYRVLVRNLVADHAWLGLRFLPGHWAAFREHLPFGFWPAVVAARLGGLGAADLLHAALSLGTLGVLLGAGRRAFGGSAGLAAALLLALTESFWRYGARVLLEPPLLLLATAAAVPLLVRPPGRRDLAWAALFGALACLVKGPFGLAPLCCAGAGRALAERSAGGTTRQLAVRLAQTALVTLLAAIPVILFLALDAQVLHQGWWDGYALRQLRDSALGARHDGVASSFFVPRVVLGRFWPGLPFALGAVVLALRAPATLQPAPGTDPRALRATALASALLLVALSVPARKWGNHVYVAFPLLALLGGAALGPLLDRLRAWRPGRLRALGNLDAVTASLLALALGATVANQAGLGRLLARPPCALGAGLSGPLLALPRGDVLVLAPTPDVAMLAAVADETGRLPWPEAALPSGDSPQREGRPVAAALVPEGTPLAQGWKPVAHAAGWELLAPRLADTSR